MEELQVPNRDTLISNIYFVSVLVAIILIIGCIFFFTVTPNYGKAKKLLSKYKDTEMVRFSEIHEGYLDLIFFSLVFSFIFYLLFFGFNIFQLSEFIKK